MVNREHEFIQTVSDYGYLQRPPPALSKQETKRHLKSQNHLRALGVAVGFRHCITVRTAVLAVVCAVRGSPGLIVHGAVETLWDSVLGKNVSIEEYLEDMSTRARCVAGAFIEHVRMT